MDERRKSSVAVIVGLAVPLVLLAFYVVGYFQLAGPFGGTYWGPSGQPALVRNYPHPVVAWLYYPAAFVEAKVKQQGVMVGVTVGTREEIFYSVAP